MPTIVVKIDKFGQPTIEADGFVGNACEKATASLEQALMGGAAKVERKRKLDGFGTTTQPRTVVKSS